MVLFLVAAFSFFIGWGVSSFVLDTFADSLIPLAPDEADETINLLEFAFGIICSFIITMIVFVFVIEGLSSEREYYWRGDE